MKNLEYTDKILEEPEFENIRKVLDDNILSLLKKGYSRFEIDCIISGDVTISILKYACQPNKYFNEKTEGEK